MVQIYTMQLHFYFYLFIYLFIYYYFFFYILFIIIIIRTKWYYCASLGLKADLIHNMELEQRKRVKCQYRKG